MNVVHAVIYLRISQDRTGEELGVARQREDTLKLAELRGWTVVAEHTDNDISASGKKHRPGFESVMEALTAGKASVVVAWDMTRLTRNSRDRLRLLEAGKKHGVTVAFVRGTDLDLSTPAGRLTADILGSVAQHEIEQKSDRQKRAALQAAESGKRTGGRRPFGYEPDGVTIRETEAQALRAAYEGILTGLSLGRVATDWNGQGLLTPQVTRKGQPSRWTGQTVRATLLNPRYAGLRSHVTEKMREEMDPRKARIAGIIGPAQWPEIVPEETWRAAVEFLMDPSRATPGRSPQALLTGVALCGGPGTVELATADGQTRLICGATVHRGASPARPEFNRPAHPTYRCSVSLGHVGRAGVPVDEYIGAVVVERLSRTDAPALLAAPDQAKQTGKLRREAATLRARLEGLAGLLADGTLTATGVRRESDKLRARLAEIDRSMADEGRLDLLGPLVNATNVQVAWDGLDTDRQRRVVDILMVVTIYPPGRGTRTFRPETVEVTWR